MPTYEYDCGNCGETSEFFQSLDEGHKRKCPKCGKLKLKKVWSFGYSKIDQNNPHRDGGFFTTKRKISTSGV